MKKKVWLLVVGIIILIGLIVLFIVTNKGKKDSKSPESNIEGNTTVIEEKESISINYKKYLELRSKVHEKETFAIIIISDDDISKTLKEETLYSFRELKSKVYEINVTKLKDTEYSGVIDDVTKIFKYKKPQITIPTLLVSKKGKIVYKKAGLVYSPDIIKNLNKNKIG